MKVENAKTNLDSNSKGNGVALANIRERLFALYDDQQTFKIKETRNSYSVIMRIPKLVFMDVDYS